MIAELESEKATFEVNAEQAGVIKLVDINEGDSIEDRAGKLASIDEKASESLVEMETPAKNSKKCTRQAVKDSEIVSKEPEEKKSKAETKERRKIEAEPAKVILPEGKP